MATRTRRKNRHIGKRASGYIAVALFLIAAIFALYILISGDTSLLIKLGFIEPERTPLEDNIEIHFIDIGQGDATLIRTPDGDILIDAGPKSDSDALEAYLKNNSVKTLEYLVFTHAHEDHIGGEAVVFDNCEIKNVIISSMPHTTNIYEKTLDDIEASGANLIVAERDAEYSLGALKMKILGPAQDEYDNINNSSVCMKITYGDTSIMMTGDAEKEAEQEMFDYYSKSELKCDLFKAGHHGSRTSMHDDFMNAVSPKIAVITCATDNKHGLPDEEVVEFFEEIKATLYRTDEHGSVVFVSNGAEITLKSTTK